MLNFENASVLDYSHVHDFFGEGVVRWRVTKNIQVQGYVLALQQTVGVASTWTGIAGFVSNSVDYDDIQLNGISFGNGRVNSLSFAEGNDVQKKAYTASLTVWGSGDLSSLAGSYYAGIDFSSFQQIESLSESFSYALNEAGNKAYTHNISLKTNSGYGLGNPINIAKQIASGLMASTNLTGFLYNTGYSIKKRYQENYNLVTNECSWTENSEFVNNLNYYSLSYTNSIKTEANGITSVTENGDIKGLAVPLSGSAASGLAAQMPLFVGRATGMFANYGPPSGYPLNSLPITKQFDINSFEGTIKYDIAYSNDPRYSGAYSWEYTQQLDCSEDGTRTVVENGNIIGFGRRLLDKYPNAQTGWANVQPGISGRAIRFYNSNGGAGTGLYLVTQAQTNSAFNGTISYNYKHTDDLSIQPGNGVRKIKIDVTDDLPVSLVNKFAIVNTKELAQNSMIATVGKRSVSVAMQGIRTLTVNDFLSRATGIISTYKSDALGNDIFASSASYQYTPNESSFSMNTEFSYHTGHLIGTIDL